MNRPLFCIGFFKVGVGSLLVATLGCTDVSSGVSSSSSVLACPGDGGLIPSPVAPEALEKYTKLSVPESAFVTKKGVTTLTKGKAMSAIVDELCILRQNANSNAITQSLRNRVTAQSTPLRERAYTLKWPYDVSATELRTLVNADSCLLSLSEEIYFSPTTTTVNDPMYSSQAHLPAIHAPEAWDTFYANLSSDVVIAIIDDGVDLTHPELSSIKWVNTGEIPGNGLDDDGNGYVDDVNGYNFQSNIGSPAHEAGSTHGTHVAGLAAAKDNNNVGISGVMGRNAKIMALNTAGPNSGSSVSAIINAINYARDKGAKVINMSLGAQSSHDPLRVAMANAVASGTFIVSAAGNNNELVSDANLWIPMGYSKGIDGAISVGAVYADSLTKTSYSNYSTSFVEIGAPGSNNTSQGLLSTIPGPSYTNYDGTSMASPVVAGAAALLIGWASAHGKTLTPAQIESALLYSADSYSSLTGYFKNGGVLNLKSLAATTDCL